MDPADLVEVNYNIGGDAADSLASIADQANLAAKALGGLTGVLGKVESGVHSVIGKLEHAFHVFNETILGGMINFDPKHIIAINKELEETTNTIAGMLQANEFVKDFNDGLTLSKKMIRDIRVDAAKLPGTEADFIQGFQVTFQAMKDAGMRDLDKMRELSNNLIAVGKAYGIHSQTTAGEVAHMLQGGAGQQMVFFRKLKGQLGVHSSQQWASLSGQDRIKRLEGLLAKNKGMLNNFENTWEAIASTAESYAKNIMMSLTDPLFQAVKGPLKQMNDYIGEFQDKILTVGRFLGTEFVGGLQAAGSFVAGSFGPGVAGLAENTASHSDAIAYVIDAAVAGFQMLAPIVEETSSFLSLVGQTLEDLFAPILPPLGYAFAILADVVSIVWTTLMEVGSYLLRVLHPAFEFVGEVVGKYAAIMLNILDVTVHEVIGLVLKVPQFVREMYARFEPVIDQVAAFFREHFVSPIQHAVNAISTFIYDTVTTIETWLNEHLGTHMDLTGGVPQIAGGFTEQMKHEYEEMKKRAAWEKANEDMKAAFLNYMAKNGKTKVEQTFNNARFNINQAFAEGFSPDRVLTAVRRDTAQLASRRLFSDITPLYSAR